PVRRATSVQKEAPSAPFSCTIVSEASSTALSTSSRVGLTKTPTTSHLRRKAAEISTATAGSTQRGLPSKWISPIAQAPSRTASAAWSRLVTQQNLTRIHGAYGKSLAVGRGRVPPPNVLRNFAETSTRPDASDPQRIRVRRGRPPPSYP